MKRIEDVMSKEQRERFADRIEVLEKVKGLLLIPQLCMATTDQVAEYFDVPVNTIRTTYHRNKAELDANGAVLMTPRDIERLTIQCEQSVAARGYKLFSVENEVFPVNYSGSRFFPKRAILCMAMLLKDSKVAEEIRTQLLNIVEAAPVEVKVANIQGQEQAMMDFARAMMSGDSAAIAQAVSAMMALKDHTIAAQAASIEKLSGEKAALESQTEDLTKRNDSLEMSNRMLAEEAVTWEPKRAVNAVMRRIGKVIYNGKYGIAWNELYRELMYQTGISVGNRGAMKKNESALSTIREDEWPQVMRTVASLACRYCIDVIDCTNEQVVEAYQLDRVQTDHGVVYNRGIVRTTHLESA